MGSDKIFFWGETQKYRKQNQTLISGFISNKNVSAFQRKQSRTKTAYKMEEQLCPIFLHWGIMYEELTLGAEMCSL